MTAPQNPNDRWSAVAKAYLRNIAPGFKPAAERLCRYVGIKRDDKVLDIGCGPGTACFAAVHMGAEVTGVDLSPEMIAIARDIAGGKKDYTFLEGDMHALPVEAGKFDVVLSSFGVTQSNSPRKAVAEMARVLVPGGRIGLLAWPRTGAMARYYDLLDKLLPQDEAHPNQFGWGDPVQVREWLAAEFDNIATADLEVPFTAKTQAAAWDALKTSTARVAQLYEKLAPDARAAVDKEMVELFRSYRKPDGTVHWPRKALMLRATKHVHVEAKSDTVFRSVIAILGGFLVAKIIGAIAIGAAASAMLAGPTAPLTTGYLAASAGAALIACGVGGWLTAQLAPGQLWKHVGGLGALLLVTGLYASFTTPNTPIWFKLASPVVSVLGAALGGLIKAGLPKKPA